MLALHRGHLNVVVLSGYMAEGQVDSKIWARVDLENYSYLIVWSHACSRKNCFTKLAAVDSRLLRRSTLHLSGLTLFSLLWLNALCAGIT